MNNSTNRLRKTICIIQRLLMFSSIARATNLNDRSTNYKQRRTNILRTLLSRRQSLTLIRRQEVRHHSLGRIRQRINPRMNPRHIARRVRRNTLARLHNLKCNIRTSINMPLFKHNRLQMITRPKLQGHHSMTTAQANLLINNLSNRDNRHHERKERRPENRGRQPTRIRLQYMLNNLIHHNRHSVTTFTIPSRTRIHNISMTNTRISHHSRKVRRVRNLFTRRMQNISQDPRSLMINNRSHMTNISSKLPRRRPMLVSKTLLNRKTLQRPTFTSSANHSINWYSRQRPITNNKQSHKFNMMTKSHSQLTLIILKRVRSTPHLRALKCLFSLLKTRGNSKYSVKRQTQQIMRNHKFSHRHTIMKHLATHNQITKNNLRQLPHNNHRRHSRRGHRRTRRRGHNHTSVRAKRR